MIKIGVRLRKLSRN